MDKKHSKKKKSTNKKATKEKISSEKPLDELRYPIGKYKLPESFSEKEIKGWIKVIEKFPARLTDETKKLSDKKLKLQYRPEGWNIRQVVHHCADSHSNAFTRFKLALTEENPTIKPYKENLWAELPDSISTPIDWSLKMLGGIHKRWTVLLKSLNNQDLERTYFHSENNRVWKLFEALALYAWHCEHHLAHVRLAKKSK